MRMVLQYLAFTVRRVLALAEGERRATWRRLAKRGRIVTDGPVGSVPLVRHYVHDETRLYVGRGARLHETATVMLGGQHPVGWVSTFPFRIHLRMPGAGADGMPEATGDTHIGAGAVVGAHAFLRSGLTIGDGAVIEAHAVVTKDVPAYTVVGGLPARVKGTRGPGDPVTGVEPSQPQLEPGRSRFAPPSRHRLLHAFLAAAIDRNEAAWRVLGRAGRIVIGRGSYGVLHVETGGDLTERLVIGPWCSLAGGTRVLLTEPGGGDTVIGADVWIGTECVIEQGVTIGPGAVVASRSHVVEDVPPYAIVAGSPARVIRWRHTPEQRDALMAIRWWDWTEAEIREAVPLLSSPDVQAFIEAYAGRRG